MMLVCRTLPFITFVTYVCSFKVPICMRYMQTSSSAAVELEASESLNWSYVKDRVDCVRFCHNMLPSCSHALYDAGRHFCMVYEEVDENGHPDNIPSHMVPFHVVQYRDCTEVGSVMPPAQSGVYVIKPCASCERREVFCDMDTDGGGWTVFQNRRDGSVDFYRDWEDYKNGFGEMCGEFWLGNEYVHKMTSSGTYELRIDIGDAEGFAVYSEFMIGPEEDKYQLNYASYIDGNKADSLEFNKGMYFSTKDRQNDLSATPCAITFKGAWWFKYCFETHLNGQFYVEPGTTAMGIIWKGDDPDFTRYFRASMKVRRTEF